MQVSAVSFTSVRNPKSYTSIPTVNKSCSVKNPYKMQDILPITTTLAGGLLLAYFYKTGKLNVFKRLYA